MSNVLAETQRLIEEHHRATHFAATVVAKSGGTIKVQRDGSPPEPNFWPAFSGVAALVSAGDRVSVLDQSGDGGFTVIGKIVNV